MTATELHTNRQRETPNADPTKFNERLLGLPILLSRPTLAEEVFSRIGDNGGRKIRSDAVLCVELLLSASPEFFRPDEQGAAGKWDAAQLEIWKQRNHRWLVETFGDRLLRVELHLDEATPHIHAYLVPLDEQGKLNCKGIFGGRQKLSQLQDSYAQAMEPLGLERGIRGSRASHSKVKEYYAAVTKAPDLELTPAEMHHQLADRQRALKENAELKCTAKALAKEVEALQQRQRELEEQLQRERIQAQEWRQRYRAMTDQLREVPLTQVAIELGLDPDSKDGHKWCDDSHILNITGSKFYDFSSDGGGGGAIDLVMHVEDCAFSKAVKWLKDRFGEPAALATITKQTQEIAAEQPREPFAPPEPQGEHWQQVRGYLTQTRGLPGSIVDSLHREGLIYADEYQNAVFLQRSLAGEVTGAALQGTIGSNAFQGLAYGTRRSQGWFYFELGQPGEIERVVLVESAIDALSHHTLHPPELRTLYLTMDKSGHVPLEQLQAVSVVVALDRDEAGEAMAERLCRDLPQAQRDVPAEEDWNSVLQLHLRNLQRQFERCSSQAKSNQLGLQENDLEI